MLLRDISLSLVEAALVLFISQLPFFMLTVKHVIDTEGASLDVATVIHVISQNVRPGEVLAYIASLLASTTVYFIIRPKLFLYRTVVCLICLLVPITIIFLATPTYMADRYGQIANKEFMGSYSIVLLIASIAIWLFAIFHQRRIENSGPSIGGDGPARDIIDRLTSGR